MDCRVSKYLHTGFVAGPGIDVEDGDGFAAGLGRRAADGHAGNVDVVPAEDGADMADEPGLIAVREDRERAVEVGVEAELAKLHQAQEFVAEERAAGERWFRRG